MDSLYQICWLILAQTPTNPGGGEGVAKAAGEAVKKPGLFESMGFLLPAGLAVMVLWMIMSARPQAKGTGRTSDLLANLKKNDRVVTAGGILGTVVNYHAGAEFVTLRVDDSGNARMQVLAGSIVRVVSDDDKKEK